MIPTFQPTWELLSYLNDNYEEFTKTGCKNMFDAISFVRVNWLLTDYGLN